MTILPAVVTPLELATVAAATAGMRFIACFTTNSVATTVQVGIEQIMTTELGALPTGGATGQLLQKASGTNFAANWVDPSSVVAGTTGGGVTVAGSTALVVSLTSVAGNSVLGVAGAATAVPAAITGTANLFLGISAGGTTQFQVINLGTAASFTGQLGVPNGGIGTSSLSENAVLLGAGTAAITAVTNTTPGFVLTSNGTLAAPSFQAPTIGTVDLSSATAVTGILPVIHGGSGGSTFVVGAVVLGGTTATSPFQTVAGTAGMVLQSRGTSTSPVYAQVNLASSASVTGVLTVPNGGIGTSAVAASALLLGGANATAALTAVVNTTSGYALLSNGTSSAPSFQTYAGGRASFAVNKGGTNQTGIVDVTPTVITWPTVSLNAGGFFTSNVWTPPSGIVVLVAASTFSATFTADGQAAITIRKNGSDIAQGTNNIAGTTSGAACSVLFIDRADGTSPYDTTCFLNMQTGSGVIIGGAHLSFFAGAWLGPV